MFEDCTGLEEIKLPNTIIVIRGYAFSGCSSLIEIVIPEGCKDIENRAFAKCTSLKKIYIPESVTEIAEDTFYQSSEVTIYGKTGSCAETYANEHGIPFVAE